MATNQPTPGQGDPPAPNANVDAALPPNPPADDPLKRMQQQLEQATRVVAGQQQQITRMQQQLQNAPTPQPPVTDQAKLKKELEDQFYKDPINASAAIARQVALENAQQQAAQGAPALDTMILLARDRCRVTDPELFDKFAPEIDHMIGQLHPQFRTNIGTWMTAFNNVKGAHVQEVADMLNKRRQTPSGSPDGPAPPSTRPANAPASSKAKLNAEEETFARRLHLTPEQYAHGRELSDNPDKWKEVITFDSREAKSKQRAAREQAAARAR